MDVSPLIRQKYNLKVNDDIESLYDDISYEASLEKGIFIISLKDRTKKELQTKLNEKYFNGSLTELSMGMSNDYKIALQEGSTFIRVGTKIFK